MLSVLAVKQKKNIIFAASTVDEKDENKKNCTKDYTGMQWDEMTLFSGYNFKLGLCIESCCHV